MLQIFPKLATSTLCDTDNVYIPMTSLLKYVADQLKSVSALFQKEIPAGEGRNLCHNLSENYPVSIYGAPAGVIESSPLSNDPQTGYEILEEIEKTKRPMLIQWTFDGEAKFCAYPINLIDTSQFDHENVIDTKYRDNPFMAGALTGLATDKYSPFNYYYGIIGYDGSSYVQNPFDKTWNAIGDVISLMKYLSATDGETLKLATMWNNDRNGLLNANLDSFSSETPPPSYTQEEVNKHLEHFYLWLDSFDPELSESVRGTIIYDPEGNGNTPETKTARWAIAEYRGKSDQIVLLPYFIQLLAENKLEDAALVIYHENAHRRLHQAGVQSPFSNIMTLSMTYLLNYASRQDPTLSLDSITSKLFSSQLTIDPSEEMAAHMSTALYAAKRLPLDKRLFQKDELEKFNGYQELLKTHEPATYYISTQFYLASTMYLASSDTEKKIIGVLDNNTKAQVACMAGQKEYCEPSEQQLAEIEQFITTNILP